MHASEDKSSQFCHGLNMDVGNCYMGVRMYVCVSAQYVCTSWTGKKWLFLNIGILDFLGLLVRWPKGVCVPCTYTVQGALFLFVNLGKNYQSNVIQNDTFTLSLASAETKRATE